MHLKAPCHTPFLHALCSVPCMPADAETLQQHWGRCHHLSTLVPDCQAESTHVWRRTGAFHPTVHPGCPQGVCEWHSDLCIDAQCLPMKSSVVVHCTILRCGLGGFWWCEDSCFSTEIGWSFSCINFPASSLSGFTEHLISSEKKALGITFLSV